MQKIREQLRDIPPDQQVEILLRRLERSENARLAAESLLESRARQLDRANRDLRAREEDLREKLDINIRQLLAAQRMAAIATVYRVRGGEVAFSPEFTRLIGLPEGAKPNSTHISGVVHPLDQKRFDHAQREFLEGAKTGEEKSYEHRIIRQNDGETRWLRWSVRRDLDEAGQFVSLSGTVQDITETRRTTRRARALGLLAERRVYMLGSLTAELEAANFAQQEANTFLQAVLDAVPQGIAVFDRDLKLAAWNAPLVSLTEIEPETLKVGMAFKSPPPLKPGAIPVPNPGKVKRDEAGNVVSETYERELSDGRIVKVDVIGRDDGSMVRTYADVSHFKSVEASLRNQREELSDRVDELISLSFELRQAKGEAERANRSKSQFLAMMSHDIRTPMNGVLGLLDTLALSKLDADQRRKLDLARESGRQLNFLLNEIIEIVRAESGKIDLQAEPVDLAATLQGVVEFWAQANANPQIVLALDDTDSLPARVLLDPTRFRQLLDNFLSNALKYTEAGQIGVRALVADEHIRVEVSDTGRGISAEDQKLLFADFSRLRDMAATTGQSAGLGLAICKRLVAAMDGAIGVESAVGKGSTFWFAVPLQEAEAPAQESATAEPAASLPALGLHILVAEDIETNRIVLTAMLDQLGCTYRVVPDGAQALTAASSDTFDCVLMDVNMPEMDGREATLAIRTLPTRHGKVRIIGVTAHVLPDTQEDLLASGMDALLPKPIALDRLAHILAEPRDTAAPLIDTDATAMLFAALAPGQAQRILAQAIADIEELSASYQSARATDDEEAAKRAAHSLKGVAANIGAAALADLVAMKPLPAGEDLSALAAETVRRLRHQDQ
ncbi:ATP-binding protein [Erythrobacter sp. EC-HK427]|uniref:ATP-binding protein n=1 Tax=Erythrobacter sp. EC-HK427 TaxID=2038396 RepID=UPI001256B485|nr:ATP-binding protein [Erythrobacter sp. EC-HK427]VVT04310.1 conserved hypothetical protein [Erythrobacter sp. EC-HK427]